MLFKISVMIVICLMSVLIGLIMSAAFQNSIKK